MSITTIQWVEDYISDNKIGTSDNDLIHRMNLNYALAEYIANLEMKSIYGKEFDEKNYLLDVEEIPEVKAVKDMIMSDGWPCKGYFYNSKVYKNTLLKLISDYQHFKGFVDPYKFEPVDVVEMNKVEYTIVDIIDFQKLFEESENFLNDLELKRILPEDLKNLEIQIEEGHKILEKTTEYINKLNERYETMQTKEIFEGVPFGDNCDGDLGSFYVFDLNNEKCSLQALLDKANREGKKVKITYEELGK